MHHSFAPAPSRGVDVMNDGTSCSLKGVHPQLSHRIKQVKPSSRGAPPRIPNLSLVARTARYPQVAPQSPRSASVASVDEPTLPGVFTAYKRGRKDHRVRVITEGENSPLDYYCLWNHFTTKTNGIQLWLSGAS